MHGLKKELLWFRINLIKRKLRPQSVTDLKQNCVSFPPGKIVEIYAFRNWGLDRKAGFEEQTSFNYWIYTKYTTTKKNYFHKNFHQFKDRLNLNKSECFIAKLIGSIHLTYFIEGWFFDSHVGIVLGLHSPSRQVAPIGSPENCLALFSTWLSLGKKS